TPFPSDGADRLWFCLEMESDPTFHDPLRLSLRHEMSEPMEQIARVVRARRGFGMVLDGVHRQIETAQALDGIIVQTDVGQLHTAVSRGPRHRFRAGSGDLSSPHGKVVVLGCDLHLPSLEVGTTVTSKP